MRKKKFLLLFWIFVLIVSVGAEAMLLKRILANMSKTVKIEEYGVEIAYPRSYIDIEKEKSDVEKISSTISVTATEYIRDNEGASVEYNNELIHAINNRSLITMLLEGIKTPKTSKTIEEICKDYMTMFKIYNQGSDILDSKYDEVMINGVQAGRVEIYVIGKRDGVFPGVITYLFPLEDREITLTFTGTKEIFNYGKAEIEKIVNSIKFDG